MLLIVGTVRLPFGGVPAALATMTDMIVASRDEDGCHKYAYGEDVLDPGLIHVNEVWRDQMTLDCHFTSAHIAAWRALWRALGLSDRSLFCYDTGTSRPV